MAHARFFPLIEWIAAAGLSGRRELDLLEGFCDRAVDAGLPLARAVVGIDTLHPVLEGRLFEWQRDTDAPTQSEYGRLDVESSEDKWLQSPFHRLYESGATTFRQRLSDRELEFPVLEDLRRRGMTDYVAMVNRFGDDGAIGLMDCTYSSWASDRPGGFADADLAALESLVPCLALAIKGASIARIAETLVETYLGRDAGHRVLRGHIERGVAEKIGAVLWFSDLQGFTRITDTASPAQIIPLLNDYADAIVSALQSHGGEVLKFMGDGILAIFAASAAADACGQALDAADDASRRVAAMNQRRVAAELPVTRFYLGLHVGDVFYGNIGSVDRLDFTVVGPAVNETSRIAAMCRSLDQQVLLSSAFANAAGKSRERLVSVGRYALRGVQRPQELYTLDPVG
jgi:adenylate cyclase